MNPSLKEIFSLKVLLFLLFFLTLFFLFEPPVQARHDACGEDTGRECNDYCDYDNQVYCVDQPDGGHDCSKVAGECGAPKENDNSSSSDDPDQEQASCKPEYVGYASCFVRKGKMQVCEVFDDFCKDDFDPIPKNCRQPNPGECDSEEPDDSGQQKEDSEQCGIKEVGYSACFEKKGKTKVCEVLDDTCIEGFTPVTKNCREPNFGECSNESSPGEETGQSSSSELRDSGCNPNSGVDFNTWDNEGLDCRSDDADSRGYRWVCKKDGEILKVRHTNGEDCFKELGSDVKRYSPSSSDIDQNFTPLNRNLPSELGSTGCNPAGDIDPVTWEYKGLSCESSDSGRRGEKWVCRTDNKILKTKYANGQKCFDGSGQIAEGGAVDDEYCRSQFGPTQYECSNEGKCIAKFREAFGDICSVASKEVNKGFCPNSCKTSASGSQAFSSSSLIDDEEEERKCRGKAPHDYYCDSGYCFDATKGWNGDACVQIYPKVDLNLCQKIGRDCKQDESSSGKVSLKDKCKYEFGDTKYFCKEDICYKRDSKVEGDKCGEEESQASDQTVCKTHNLNCGRTLSPEEINAGKDAECKKAEEPVFYCDGVVCIGKTLGFDPKNNKCDYTYPKVDPKFCDNKCEYNTVSTGLISGDDVCKYKNPTVYYCDREVCIAKTKKSQGNSCIDDFKTADDPKSCGVGACKGNKASSGQAAPERPETNPTPKPVLSPQKSNQSLTVGAACNYLEACIEGGTKVCRGELVGKENNEVICEFKEGSSASCTACTEKPINLKNKDNSCDIQDNKAVCLNPPGQVCVTASDCPQPPPPVVTRTVYNPIPIGVGQVRGNDGNIYDAIKVCEPQKQQFDAQINRCLDLAACDAGFDNFTQAKESYEVCVTKYVYAGKGYTVIQQEQVAEKASQIIGAQQVARGIYNARVNNAQVANNKYLNALLNENLSTEEEKRLEQERIEAINKLKEIEAEYKIPEASQIAAKLETTNVDQEVQTRFQTQQLEQQIFNDTVEASNQIKAGDEANALGTVIELQQKVEELKQLDPGKGVVAQAQVNAAVKGSDEQLKIKNEFSEYSASLGLYEDALKSGSSNSEKTFKDLALEHASEISKVNPEKGRELATRVEAASFIVEAERLNEEHARISNDKTIPSDEKNTQLANISDRFAQTNQRLEEISPELAADAQKQFRTTPFITRANGLVIDRVKEIASGHISDEGDLAYQSQFQKDILDPLYAIDANLANKYKDKFSQAYVVGSIKADVDEAKRLSASHPEAYLDTIDGNIQRANAKLKQLTPGTLKDPLFAPVINDLKRTEATINPLIQNKEQAIAFNNNYNLALDLYRRSEIGQGNVILRELEGQMEQLSYDDPLRKRFGEQLNAARTYGQITREKEEAAKAYAAIPDLQAITPTGTKADRENFLQQQKEREDKLVEARQKMIRTRTLAHGLPPELEKQVMVDITGFQHTQELQKGDLKAFFVKAVEGRVDTNQSEWWEGIKDLPRVLGELASNAPQLPGAIWGGITSSFSASRTASSESGLNDLQAESLDKFKNAGSLESAVLSMGFANTGGNSTGIAVRAEQAAEAARLKRDEFKNWSEDERAVFLQMLAMQNPDPLAWWSENMAGVGLPISDTKKLDMYKRLCYQKYGHTCGIEGVEAGSEKLFNAQNFGGIKAAGFSEADAQKAKPLIEKYLPDFEPVPAEDLLRYTRAIQSECGILNPRVDQRCRTNLASALGVSEEKLRDYEKSVDAYNFVGEKLKEDTYFGQKIVTQEAALNRTLGLLTAQAALVAVSLGSAQGIAVLPLAATGVDIITDPVSLAKGIGSGVVGAGKSVARGVDNLGDSIFNSTVRSVPEVTEIAPTNPLERVINNTPEVIQIRDQITQARTQAAKLENELPKALEGITDDVQRATHEQEQRAKIEALKSEADNLQFTVLPDARERTIAGVLDEAGLTEQAGKSDLALQQHIAELERAKQAEVKAQVDLDLAKIKQAEEANSLRGFRSNFGDQEAIAAREAASGAVREAEEGASRAREAVQEAQGKVDTRTSEIRAELKSTLLPSENTQVKKAGKAVADAKESYDGAKARFDQAASGSDEAAKSAAKLELDQARQAYDSAAERYKALRREALATAQGKADELIFEPIRVAEAEIKATKAGVEAAQKTLDGLKERYKKLSPQERLTTEGKVLEAQLDRAVAERSLKASAYDDALGRFNGLTDSSDAGGIKLKQEMFNLVYRSAGTPSISQQLAAIQDLKRLIKELGEGVNVKDQEINNLQELLNKKQQLLDELAARSRRADIEKDIEITGDNLAEAKAEVAELTQKVTDLENEIKQIEARFASLQAIGGGPSVDLVLQDLKNQLERAKAQLKRRVEEFIPSDDQNLAALKRKLAELDQAIQKTEVDEIVLRRKIREALGEKARLAQGIERGNHLLQEATTNLATKSQSELAVKPSYSEGTLVAARQRLEAQIPVLAQRLQEAESKLAKADETLKGVQKDQSSFPGKIMSLIFPGRSKQRLEAAQTAYDLAQKEVGNLKDALDKSNKRLDEIKNPGGATRITAEEVPAVSPGTAPRPPETTPVEPAPRPAEGEVAVQPEAVIRQAIEQPEVVAGIKQPEGGSVRFDIRSDGQVLPLKAVETAQGQEVTVRIASSSETGYLDATIETPNLRRPQIDQVKNALEKTTVDIDGVPHQFKVLVAGQRVEKAAQQPFIFRVLDHPIIRLGIFGIPGGLADNPVLNAGLILRSGLLTRVGFTNAVINLVDIFIPGDLGRSIRSQIPFSELFLSSNLSPFDMVYLYAGAYRGNIGSFADRVKTFAPRVGNITEAIVNGDYRTLWSEAKLIPGDLVKLAGSGVEAIRNIKFNQVLDSIRDRGVIDGLRGKGSDIPRTQVAPLVARAVNNVVGPPNPIYSVNKGVIDKATRKVKPNEDAAEYISEKGLGVVLDGAGGSANGFAASQGGLRTILSRVNDFVSNNVDVVVDKVEDTLRQAHKSIKSEGHGGYTTATVVKMVQDESGTRWAVVGQVGDSRAYVLRNNKLIPITVDDVYIGLPEATSQRVRHALAEAKSLDELIVLAGEDADLAMVKFENRNVIDEALGHSLNPSRKHVSKYELLDGDKIVILSDGVHDNLAQSEIEAILNHAKPGTEAEALGKAAQSRQTGIEKGHFRSKLPADDISAVVMETPVGNRISLAPCPIKLGTKDNSSSIISSLLGISIAQAAGPCPIPKTPSDIRVMEAIEGLKTLPEQDIALFDKAARQIAVEAQKVDYVITSGDSRTLSTVLLTKNGVDPGKIIEFDNLINSIIYKTGADDPPLDSILKSLSPKDRIGYLKEALEGSGVDLSKNPTFLIVDDHVDTGGKTVSYLTRFSQVEGIGETKYTVLTTKEGRVINPELAGKPVYENLSAKEIEALQTRIIIPSGLTQGESVRLFDLTDRYGQVFFNYRNLDKVPEGIYSPEVIDYVRRSEEDVLRRLDPKRSTAVEVKPQQAVGISDELPPCPLTYQGPSLASSNSNVLGISIKPCPFTAGFRTVAATVDNASPVIEAVVPGAGLVADVVNLVNGRSKLEGLILVGTNKADDVAGPAVDRVVNAVVNVAEEWKGAIWDRTPEETINTLKRLAESSNPITRGAALDVLRQKGLIEAEVGFIDRILGGRISSAWEPVSSYLSGVTESIRGLRDWWDEVKDLNLFKKSKLTSSEEVREINKRNSLVPIMGGEGLASGYDNLIDKAAKGDKQIIKTFTDLKPIYENFIRADITDAATKKHVLQLFEDGDLDTVYKVALEFEKRTRGDPELIKNLLKGSKYEGVSAESSKAARRLNDVIRGDGGLLFFKLDNLKRVEGVEDIAKWRREEVMRKSWEDMVKGKASNLPTSEQISITTHESYAAFHNINENIRQLVEKITRMEGGPVQVAEDKKLLEDVLLAREDRFVTLARILNPDIKVSEVGQNVYQIGDGSVYGGIFSVMDVNTAILEHQSLARKLQLPSQKNTANLLGEQIVPGELDAAVVFTGSTAQIRAQPFAADIDMAEYVIVKANTQKEASDVFAKGIQKSVDKVITIGEGEKKVTLYFSEMKIGGKYPSDVDLARLPTKAGKPDITMRWSAEEIKQGYKDYQIINGGIGRITLQQAAINPDVIKVDYIGVTQDRVIEITKNSFVRASAPDGATLISNYPTRALAFQEVYFTNPSPFGVIERMFTADGYIDYLDAMRSEVRSYSSPGYVNNVKVLKRLYNYVRTEGDLALALEIAQMFPQEAPKINQLVDRVNMAVTGFSRGLPVERQLDSTVNALAAVLSQSKNPKAKQALEYLRARELDKLSQVSTEIMNEEAGLFIKAHPNIKQRIDQLLAVQ